MTRLHGGILSLLAGLLAVSTTGCMIGPTHREHIGNVQNKISPGGFVLDGDMLIEVQAYHFERQRWETVATTRSSKGSNAWDGYDWHYWQTPQFSLPYEYWEQYWFGTGEGQLTKFAKLRALGDGGQIFTFKEWNLGPLSDMEADIHGTELIILGDLFYIE